VSRRVTIGLITSAIVVLAAIAGVIGIRAYADRPAVESTTPTAGSVVSAKTPIHVVLQSAAAAEDVRLAIDGHDVTSTITRSPDGFGAPLPALADGPHEARVTLTGTGLFAERSDYTWGFTTDSTLPSLTVAPTSMWSTTATVKGTTEPRATVTAEWKDGQVVARAGSDGSFDLRPELNDGVTPVTIVAADAAGNKTTIRRTLRVDGAEPSLNLSGIREWYTDTDQPGLYVFVDDASPTQITATLNGQVAKTTLLPIGYRIDTGQLPQGTSTIVIRVTDRAGHATEQTRELGVDSTETLTNDLTLTLGARGNDVARLTRRLRLEKAWTGKPSWIFDAQVEQAVRDFQAKAGLPVDGIARPALLERTAGRIIVFKSKFVLDLFLDGKLVKQYPVAVGQPLYPTPTGDFVITDMEKDPTWTPPNSPWAAGLEPIPPGATNPLGTRWIGTSASLVGIHGTPQDWTIGSAASHGCVRMHIADVEDLYDRVSVGMPVELRE